jgi:nucleoside-diphosphate-sugar epimerase
MRPPIQNASHRPPRGRVLITGGAGFVGAALARQLVENGREVVVIDDLSGGRRSRLPVHSKLDFVLGDAGDPERLVHLLSDGPWVTQLVHLAAVVGVRRVLADPEGCRAAHERLGASVASALSAVAADRRPRLWAASTSEVYAESRGALDELSTLRPVDGRGRWAYAGSKLAAEQRFDRLAPLWERAESPVHLRFFNVVGPGQDADSGMVLPNFVESARAGLPLEVHGDGRQERTFAHVADVAACLADLLSRSGMPAGPLNLGGDAVTTIGALATLVNERAGNRSRIVRVDPRQSCGASFEDVRRRVPNLARLRELSTCTPSRSLVEIVDDCLAAHPRTGALAAGAGRNACASPAS